MKWSIGWLRSPGTGKCFHAPEFLKQSACKGRRPDRVCHRAAIVPAPRPHRAPAPRAPRRALPRRPRRLRQDRPRHASTPTPSSRSTTCSGSTGRSPCFLRDLDRGIIVSTLTVRPGPHILPRGGRGRAAPRQRPAPPRLSRVIDDAAGGADDEVLATCAPSCDAYAGRFSATAPKLAAADLLLSDAECRLVPPGESQGRAKGRCRPPSAWPACGGGRTTARGCSAGSRAKNCRETSCWRSSPCSRFRREAGRTWRRSCPPASKAT